ncbi:DUF2946 family protein [Pararoseomonas indoligenes]|uniref:DUF2946 domain-containing protein n=1 Tax=Roseomonas indoligenes TaxID=2820811 RepID=A0A940N2M2_9PROT|nr:DUF2946 family protein [Pararoseomonas indoligenes]MBP0494060.1 hypothetical protein [Pararoseomonas indoligenes]
MPMRRPWAGFARFVALLLLLQWVGAVLPHARALGALAGAVRVELCTHEGTRTVLLDEEGRPVPTAPDLSCCDLHAAPAALAAPEPAVLALRLSHPAPPPEPSRAGLPPLPARAPPQQPRAPPAA